MILHKRWRAGVACWGTSSGSRGAGPGEHCLTQSVRAARSPPWPGAGAAIWRWPAPPRPRDATGLRFPQAGGHTYSGNRKCQPAPSGVGLGGMFLLVARPLGVETAVEVDAVIGVGAEVVAQALDQGGGQPLPAQTVVEGDCG